MAESAAAARPEKPAYGRAWTGRAVAAKAVARTTVVEKLCREVTVSNL